MLGSSDRPARRRARLALGVAPCALLALTLAGCGGGGAAPVAGVPAPAPAPAPAPPPPPAPTPPPPPPAAVEIPFGYFALTTRRLTDAQKAALVGRAQIAGMTSYVTWADIEPVQGALDFSRIDADIAIARAAGKRITIGVFTGRDALPAWLEAAGVRLWTSSAGTRLIHPADTRFLDLWRDRVAALGARYDGDPTVVQVTICGAAGTLCGPRYPELPPDIGFDQLVANWSRVTDFYLAAFPNTWLNLEIQATTGFGGDLPAALLARLPAAARIGPFAEFLSAAAPQMNSPIGQVFAAAAAGRAFCGFQTVSPLGADLDAGLALGRSYGCRYFELYAEDVEARAGSLPSL